MSNTLARLCSAARIAVRNRDWSSVSEISDQLIRTDVNHPDGHFFRGLSEKVKRNPVLARESFQKALELNPRRYDAAIELANQFSVARRNSEAVEILGKYESELDQSPLYLDLAGNVYNDIGMPQKAYPLFKKAMELQPNVDLFQANFASSAVYMGEIEEAREIYRSLLKRFPGHSQNHYQLSRLAKAENLDHVRQMQELARKNEATPEKNIFLYYAIGKELEDLQQWEESFRYYKKGGDAVCSVTDYDVNDDIALIDRTIELCTADWLADAENEPNDEPTQYTPVFIVGLPRTGTTLTERIIASHSQVQSLGETMFLQMILRQESQVETLDPMNREILESIVATDMRNVARGYEEAVHYRLGSQPYFIDKLPFNFNYLGFIAKAWPTARIIHLVRNPMDACFSMYKQVFTWAYKFSYSLDWLGRYYIAYNRLRNHWQHLLGDRLIELQYEDLVADSDGQIRSLIEQLNLPFEQGCLEFNKNNAPSTTASSVQVRQKVYSGSVNRWRQFEAQLAPLKDQLENAGIRIPPVAE